MELFSEFIKQMGLLGILLIGIIIFFILKFLFGGLFDGEHYNGEIDLNKVKNWFKFNGRWK